MIIEFIFCYMSKDEAISLLKKDICKFDHKKWNILKLKWIKYKKMDKKFNIWWHWNWKTNFTTKKTWFSYVI